MKKLHHIFVLTICFITFFSCASKRLTKHGKSLEMAGMYIEAASYYQRALQKNSNNLDAQIGLKQNGQLVLNKYYEEFMVNYKQSEYKEALSVYKKIERYISTSKRLNVQLLPQENYKSYYEDAKEIFLDERYEVGRNQLLNEEFSKALVTFQEITRIDRHYRDASSKLKLAEFEPIYRKGEEYLASNQPRAAYYAFNRVQDNMGDFKSVIELKKESLRIAQFPIGFIPFKNSTSRKGKEKIFYASLMSDVQSSNNIFIKIIDLENQKLIEQKQLESLYSSVSPELRIKYGETIGAKAILTGTLLTFYSKNTPIRAHKVKGYLKEKQTYEDEEGNEKERTIYKKTTYYSYSGKNQVDYSFSYKLTSLETGEILLSDIISGALKDEINFSKYSGNYKNLVPGFWENKNSESNEDYFKTNYTAISSLRNQFTARKTLTTLAEIEEEAFQRISKSIVKKVTAYNPEK